MNPALPADLAAAVSLGGEMGRRFAEFDWQAHPWGAPRDWPAEVRAAVATTLTSRFPLVLWLGTQDLFVVYNEAYIEILGERHPAALGQPGRKVWWGIWESVGSMLAGVVSTGEATWSRDLMLPMVTAGRREERYFTFTYSPLIGGDGKPFGVFCPSYETTERVIRERRLHLLHTVAAAMMETRSIDDPVGVAVTVCTGHPADLPFIAVYVDDPDAGEGVLRGATASVRPLLPRDLGQLTDWDTASQSRAEVSLIDDVAAVVPGIEEALTGDCPQQAL